MSRMSTSIKEASTKRTMKPRGLKHKLDYESMTMRKKKIQQMKTNKLWKLIERNWHWQSHLSMGHTVCLKLYNKFRFKTSTTQLVLSNSFDKNSLCSSVPRKSLYWEIQRICMGTAKKCGRKVRQHVGGMHGTPLESQYYPLFFSVSLEQYSLNQ